MNSRSLRSLILLVCLSMGALVLPGCGKSSKATAPSQTPLTPSQASDAAAQVSTLIMSGGASPLPALMSQGPAALSRVRRASPTAAAAETTITGPNFTWTFSIRWFDAQGNEQVSYQPLQTTRMVADSRGSGSFEGSGAVIEIGTSGHLDVVGVGIEQTQLTTNATQADTLRYSVADSTSSVLVRVLASGGYHDVIENKPVESGYPLSGTASWSLDVLTQVEGSGGNATQSYSATAVVTFNGTHLVPLVVDGTWHFTLDLDTGEVTPVAV